MSSIKLKLAAEIPAELVGESDRYEKVFRFPLDGFGGASDPDEYHEDGYEDLPDPPVGISCGGLTYFYAGGILKVFADGSIQVSSETVAADPDQVVARIRMILDVLPALWAWALECRRRQERLVTEISALLGGQPVSFTENDRWSISTGLLNKIRTLAEKFREAGEAIPAQQGGWVAAEVLYLLEEKWRNLPSVKAQQAAQNAEIGQSLLVLEEKGKSEEYKRRFQAEEALRKAGLL